MTDDLPHHRMTPIVKALLAAVILTFLLLGVLWWQSDNRADDSEAQVEALVDEVTTDDVVIEELAGDVEALRAQAREEGLVPVAPDPDITIREVAGPAGTQGIQGLAGRDGRDGADGITPACWFEQAQCQGADGVDGVNGEDGEDGADSTVPGPQGPAGPSGSDGAPGPACPPGYEPRVIDQGPNQGWIACAPIG